MDVKFLFSDNNVCRHHKDWWHGANYIHATKVDPNCKSGCEWKANTSFKLNDGDGDHKVKIGVRYGPKDPFTTVKHVAFMEKVGEIPSWMCKNTYGDVLLKSDGTETFKMFQQSWNAGNVCRQNCFSWKPDPPTPTGEPCCLPAASLRTVLTFP